MCAQFDVSPSVINLSIALFLVASALFSLWWAMLSSSFGRRLTLLVSFLLNIPLTLACGLSPNVAFLIAFRLLAGGASSSGQTVGAGVIADIWRPEERAFAMSIFYLGPVAGSLAAPLIGGLLTERFGWQSVMWFSAAQGALVFMLILVALPETMGGQLGKGRDEAALEDANNQTATSRAGYSSLLRKALFPFSLIAILRFPVILVTVFLASMAFSSCFVLNISLEAAFAAPPYSYGPSIVGVLFLPSSLGCIFASVLGGGWVDKIMVRNARQAGRVDQEGQLYYVPEDRLGINVWVSLALYPLSLILYGWTIQYGMHWAVPSVAGFFFGMGVMMIFSATTTMAAEFVPKSSASGVAVSNLVRSVFSCIGTMIAQPLIDVMEHGWLFVMVGLFSWTTGYLCVFLLRRYGATWRKSMDT